MSQFTVRWRQVLRARPGRREGLLWLAMFGFFGGLLLQAPIVQDPRYHDFADRRVMLGVPNLFDVASNLGFLVVGLWGVTLCLGGRRPALAAIAWTAHFGAVGLVFFGSAYYHWAPSDATLLWDRLPIALAAASLLVAVWAEQVAPSRQSWLLPPFLALAVVSVLWWRVSGDLRFYLCVQFAPLLGVLLLLLLFPARYTHRRYLVYGIGLYVLAKAAEAADGDIFAFTGQRLSGHTLKHLLASAALAFVLAMLLRRAAPTVADPTRPSRRRRVLPILIGNAFEWFDFTLYGFFATMIAREIFPPGEGQAALLLGAAAFGVAFVMRPIGALTFGLIGDRWGRKTALTASIVLMALGTAMIGLAPAYDQLGLFGTGVLVAGRLLQGFSASGEAGSALALLIETSPEGRRGVATGWLNVGVYSALVFGSLCALAVTTLLPPEQAQAWGWRVPFLFGVLIAPVGLYMRLRMDESAVFLADRGPIDPAAGDATRQAWRGIVTMIGLAGFASPVVYLILIFMPAFAVRELALAPQVPMLSTLMASLLLVALLVPAGWLCDRLGCKPILVASAALGTALVVPLMQHLLHAPSLASLLLLQCAMGACLALYVTSGGPIAVELFPVRRRALGIGLGYNTGIIVFGAFAPYLTVWLTQVSGDRLTTAWYVMGAGAVAVLVAGRLRQPARRNATAVAA